MSAENEGVTEVGGRQGAKAALVSFSAFMGE
jgi:hypothetical protein